MNVCDGWRAECPRWGWLLRYARAGWAGAWKQHVPRTLSGGWFFRAGLDIAEGGLVIAD